MRRALLIIVATLLSAGCQITDWQTHVDERLDAYTAPQPGLSLRILEKDEVVFERTLGLATIDPTTAVSASSNFRLASITKHFTALSI